MEEDIAGTLWSRLAEQQIDFRMANRYSYLRLLEHRLGQYVVRVKHIEWENASMSHFPKRVVPRIIQLFAPEYNNKYSGFFYAQNRAEE